MYTFQFKTDFFLDTDDEANDTIGEKLAEMFPQLTNLTVDKFEESGGWVNVSGQYTPTVNKSVHHDEIMAVAYDICDQLGLPSDMLYLSKN